MTNKVLLLKAAWMKAVLGRDVKKIASLYSNNALFKGTMMKRPVKDKKEIEKYFSSFSKKVTSITFSESVTTRKDSLITELGKYKFKTKDGSINAMYAMVFEIKEDQVKIISHFSSRC